MVRLQIVERENAHLYRSLLDAIRAGELRTFVAERRGRRLTHVNESYPGWIKWSHTDGVITCEILSPRKPGTEWRLLSAFIGRLADKYPSRVHSIHIQFPQAAAAGSATARTRARRKR